MTVSPAVNMVQVERYASLKDAKRLLEAEIAKIQEELTKLEPQLLDTFADQGVSSIKTTSGFTVYLRRQWWAGPKDGDYEKACEALRDAGLEGMIHEQFSTQTLSAWVRERKKEGEALPPSFDDAIVITEKFNVLARKS